MPPVVPAGGGQGEGERAEQGQVPVPGGPDRGHRRGGGEDDGAGPVVDSAGSGVAAVALGRGGGDRAGDHGGQADWYGQPPARSELERLARNLGTSPDAVLAGLAGADAIAVSPGGEIRAAYPFSPARTPIRVSCLVRVTGSAVATS